MIIACAVLLTRGSGRKAGEEAGRYDGSLQRHFISNHRAARVDDIEPASCAKRVDLEHDRGAAPDL